MMVKRFKCTLLADVILNMKSASEGPNTTLDFIPGNTFLGIVASSYDDFGDDAMAIFHSGEVRFGDAHRALNGHRTLHVPASSFSPKLAKKPLIVYNHHMNDVNSEEFRSLQLKQHRDGFIDYLSESPVKVVTATHFAVKSAYDRDKRRAADEKMFAYESLEAGSVFFFSVESENEALLEKITGYLTGIKRIGRSRSAQYGLIRIEPESFEEVASTSHAFHAFDTDYYSVYADGRIIFMDEYGFPSFHPSAQDLGFEEGTIDWTKSQIRTFQYAPYNWKRKVFDADRCGFEKGSVFIVKSSSSPSVSGYVGCFKNEGFGRVIYNPAFLSIPSYTESEFTDGSSTDNHIQSVNEGDTSPLLTHLYNKREADIANHRIYGFVNDWAKNHIRSFAGEAFASQWGAIRSIALLCRNSTYMDLKNKIEEYIGHGVAADRWNDRNRKKSLRTFIDTAHDNVPGYEWAALVNLSSVMAKLSSK